MSKNLGAEYKENYERRKHFETGTSGSGVEHRERKRTVRQRATLRVIHQRATCCMQIFRGIATKQSSVADRGNGFSYPPILKRATMKILLLYKLISPIFHIRNFIKV